MRSIFVFVLGTHADSKPTQEKKEQHERAKEAAAKQRQKDMEARREQLRAELRRPVSNVAA